MSAPPFNTGYFAISSESLNRKALRTALQDVSSGAFVLFEGWVRDHNEGRKVLQLEYEVYEPLAITEGNAILQEARERFAISQAAAVHRQGLLALTEPAVLVGVSAAHRGAAFDACRYIIDEVKARLPIWKREHYADGTTEWVNCLSNPAAGNRSL